MGFDSRSIVSYSYAFLTSNLSIPPTIYIDCTCSQAVSSCLHFLRFLYLKSFVSALLQKTLICNTQAKGESWRSYSGGCRMLSSDESKRSPLQLSGAVRCSERWWRWLGANVISVNCSICEQKKLTNFSHLIQQFVIQDAGFLCLGLQKATISGLYNVIKKKIETFFSLNLKYFFTNRIHTSIHLKSFSSFFSITNFNSFSYIFSAFFLMKLFFCIIKRHLELDLL